MNKIKEFIKKNYHIIIIVALMLGSAFLFFAYSSGLSIRLDESQSLWQTSRSLTRMYEIISEDVHVPIFHTLLHFWQLNLGNDITVARLMVYIFFFISIPVFYKLVASAFKNKNIAVFSVVLFASSPFLNWYSSEVRMYSILIFLTLLNQIFFIRFLKNSDKKPFLGYLITSILGIYTHYFFAFTLVTQAIFYILERKSFKKKTFIKLTAVALGVALAILPWLLFVFSQGSAGKTQPRLFIPSSVDLFNTFSQFLFGFQEDAINTIILSLWPITVIVAFIFLKRRSVNIQPETKYFMLASIVPIILVFFLSYIIRPIYVSRYLIYTLPAMYIVISVILSKYTNILQYFFKSLLIIAIFGFFSIQIMSPNTPVKENYKEAVEYIESNVTVRDVVVIGTPLTIYPIEYYYKGPTPIYTVPIWDRTAEGGLPAFSEERITEDTKVYAAGHEKMYLLLSYDQGNEEDLRLFYDHRYQRLDIIEFSHGITLYIYQLNYYELRDPITI